MFEEQNEGVNVQTSFAGSSELLAQVQQGAPADVFASADEAKMDAALGGGSRDGAGNLCEEPARGDRACG
jgi:molybdate transport system substrate-binding protein